MAEKQYSEWLKYRKWYEKQENKGFALSDSAYVWYDSFEEYMRQYDYMQITKEREAKREKKEKEENYQKRLRGEKVDSAAYTSPYRDKSLYDMIKDRSYVSTSAQSDYFYNRVVGILNDLEAESQNGDSSATDTLNDFYIKYGDLRQVDKQELIYKGLKEGSLHFEYHDSKHYGWHGNLMDMMNYFQMNGIIDQIYV